MPRRYRTVLKPGQPFVSWAYKTLDGKSYIGLSSRRSECAGLSAERPDSKRIVKVVVIEYTQEKVRLPKEGDKCTYRQYMSTNNATYALFNKRGFRGEVALVDHKAKVAVVNCESGLHFVRYEWLTLT